MTKTKYIYKFLAFTMTDDPPALGSSYDEMSRQLVNDLGDNWEIFKDYHSQPAVSFGPVGSITIPPGLAFILRKEVKLHDDK